MYQGNLIEQLIAVVERVERGFSPERADVLELERWYASTERDAGRVPAAMAGAA